MAGEIGNGQGRGSRRDDEHVPFFHECVHLLLLQRARPLLFTELHAQNLESVLKLLLGDVQGSVGGALRRSFG